MDLAVNYKKKPWFSVAKDFPDDIKNLYDFNKVPALVAIHTSYNEHSIDLPEVITTTWAVTPES